MKEVEAERCVVSFESVGARGGDAEPNADVATRTREGKESA